MRTIQADAIAQKVAELCVTACTVLPKPVRALLEQAQISEPYAPARESLSLVCENCKIAEQNGIPICQDTGMTVVIAEVGQDVHIEGGTLEDAVNCGVRKGYMEGYLRKSVVADPFNRVNTGDNTPAALHVKLVAGDRIRLIVAPKGFGSENMSRLQMLTPADGIKGVKEFVLDTMKRAGANPCPPVILGVGVGGTFEQVALLAKEALIELRQGDHPDPVIDALEKELLTEINRLGIGPQGYGGQTTALALRIKTAPTHIAGLPVAVNVGCHATRRAEAML
ncbi:MAG TPA: fumarate hydratase [Candidatus Limiplasma sp.]|nr:fumarate hydratase [Candidatus Limiplasma sp.]HRX07887.1 fumarate hydratase [Candidatus Limiplasma sp.]